MHELHVAAAVIRGTDGRILLAQRPAHKHQGGLWEFPGGKVEAGESVLSALARELREELGIQVTHAQPLIQVRHAYPDCRVLLDVYEVTGFTGDAHGAEGQPLAWVAARELLDYEFPEANRPIVAAARLPNTYLITPDDEMTPAELIKGVRQALANGVQLVQLRAPQAFIPEYRDLATDIQGLCAGK
ncbi:MAG: Nudix family hydrolase, partial [Pseudomonas sp.]